MPSAPRLKSGFSLVELSIALVIIGLLVGGVMAGRSLIHSAQLKSVVSELTTYREAVYKFQDLYSGYPGDLYNAADIWGIRAGTGSGSACAAVPATDKRTCNGDGNYKVTDTTLYEYFLFWQHLANAGFIEGQYTGSVGPGGPRHHVIGVNSPASRFPNVGWSVPHYTIFGGSTLVWARPEEYGYTLTVGGETSNTFTYERAFTVLDVYNLDLKMDDGKPGLGNVQVMHWPECSTATGSGQYATAEYALNNTGSSQCAIMFPYVINPKVRKW